MDGRSTLVIGIGNPYRQDDGAGVAVVRRLRERLPPGAQGVECSDDLTRLIHLWQGYERVILVDAMSSGQAAGTVIRVDLSEHPLPAGARFSSTHALSLGEVIALARTLHQLPARVVLYGMEGERFDEGEGLSPAVAKAVEDVVRYILQELTENDA